MVRGSNAGGGEIFRTCPDRPWGPPSLVYNVYRVFPGGNERQGRDAEPSPPSSVVIMEDQSYTFTPAMGRTAWTEPQCLYKGALYLHLPYLEGPTFDPYLKSDPVYILIFHFLTSTLILHRHLRSFLPASHTLPIPHVSHVCYMLIALRSCPITTEIWTCLQILMWIKIQQMQQYAYIYLLQNYSTCFGCHSTHHQEY